MARKKYDLVVVGTGFASTFFLKKFLESTASPKIKILVLERGDYFPYAQRLKKARGEEIIHKPEQAQNTYINNNRGKQWVFEPNFGGGSNCWTGCTPRFMPNDFKLKTLYGVGADWPLSYDDLEPYYTEAEEIMAIAGPGITPYPRSKKHPLPPLQLSTVDKLLQREYGELYISQPTARASMAVGNRSACCSSSVCRLCPVNAKFTIENTLKEVYQDERIEIIYNAQVFNLGTEGGQVRSVQYDQQGATIEVDAGMVVLGANAIFNAHILLNAGDDNKHTGTGLCEQAGTFVNFYLDGLNNVGGSSIITANGFMLYDGDHRQEYAACLIESFNDPYIRNEPGKWRQIAKFKFIFEDLPNENNKVMLSGDKLIPVVHFKERSDYVYKAMDALKGNVEKTFSFLPIERMEMDGYFQETEFHICSTTRMSKHASDGVVDKNMIHHQYRNLIVLGSGVFPSITPANPTLTLSALALMASDKNFN